MKKHKADEYIKQYEKNLSEIEKYKLLQYDILYGEQYISEYEKTNK